MSHQPQPVHCGAAAPDETVRPRLPVPAEACQVRSGEIQTVRSTRAISPWSYSRQFRVRYQVLGRLPCVDALLIHGYLQELRSNAHLSGQEGGRSTG